VENGDLNFLKNGRTYETTVYEDDGQGGISKRKIQLKKGDHFDFNIAAAGGQALILR